jgi:hypothetical protein
MSRRSAIKVSVMSLAALASPLANSRESPGAWAVAGGGAMAAERSDEYAWRLFVALNWPADPLTRAADRSARFGADRPVVWEAWKDANEVYLARGADPGPWHEAGSAATALPAALRFESVSPSDFPNLKHIVGGVMVPVSEPLIGGERLTEIHMNRSVYDYIRAARLYCLDDQMERYRQGRPVAFPSTAQQVKAKWRPITEQERSRYHTVEVVLPDGRRKLYGLIALHIATKDLPTWFWATFEHVDNAAAGEGWKLPSRDTFACGRAAPDCNRVPLGLGLAGTVWQNYRLRGTLTGFVDSQGRPRLLGNSALETGMQSSASCITCHARSAIGVRNDQPVRLPILASGNGGGGGSTGTGDGNDSGNGDGNGGASGASNGDGNSDRASGGSTRGASNGDGDSDRDRGGSTRGVAERRGFVGVPQAEWFRAEADLGHSASPLLPLDFVWSLSKAKRRASVAQASTDGTAVDSGPSRALAPRASIDGAAVDTGPSRVSAGRAPNVAMSGLAAGFAALGTPLAQD